MQSRDLLKLWNLGNILKQNANGLHCVVPGADRERGQRQAWESTGWGEENNPGRINGFSNSISVQVF